MQTFNGDRHLKTRLLSAAGLLSSRIASCDSKTRRDSIYFSARSACDPQFLCNKPGCDHRFYADEVGVPVSIAYAERALFLELPDDIAAVWWKRFLSAIPVGVDLDEKAVFRALALYVLEAPEHGLLSYVHTGEQHAVISAVADLYRNNSPDADAWKAAADNARKAYGKSRYNNSRMESEEALMEAGCTACRAAACFADAFSEPRYADTAIATSGWCARYKYYALSLAGYRDQNKDVKVDERGLVNVGEALWASGMRVRDMDKCEHIGEGERSKHYVRVASHLVKLLKAAAPGNFITRPLYALLSKVA